METAKRYNEDKLRWSLVPMDVLEEVVRVFETGAKKYGDYNWQKGFSDPNTCYDSMMRHLQAYYQKGEVRDEESGCHHLAHAITNLIFDMYLNKDRDN